MIDSIDSSAECLILATSKQNRQGIDTMKTTDLQQQVTDQIVAILESGASPWVKPWSSDGASGMPHNHSTGKAYQGINVLILWAAGCERGFTSSAWLTYKQAQAAGGQVRKGEKGTAITFYKPIKVEKEGEEKTIPLMKTFTVFNTDQIDGLEVEVPEDQPKVFTADQKTDSAVRLFECYTERAGIDFSTGGDRAFYSPSHDTIKMPERAEFTKESGYAATLLHEAVHSTGHKNRLDRFKDTTKNGYAFEELVAEIGAAFLCCDLGITNEMEQHASYIDSWLKALKNDRTLIFKAAAKASKAYELITQPDAE